MQAPCVTAKLESKDGKDVYASADIDDISPSWSHVKLMLTSSATDDKAQLTLYIDGEADVAVRLVSLFPAKNVEGEVLQPFRPDILQYLKDLQPRFSLHVSCIANVNPPLLLALMFIQPVFGHSSQSQQDNMLTEPCYLDMLACHCVLDSDRRSANLQTSHIATPYVPSASFTSDIQLQLRTAVIQLMRLALQA